MSGFDLVTPTPIATFHAYFDVSTYIPHSNVLEPYWFSREIDNRIKLLQKFDTIIYEARNAPLVVNRVKYERLYAIVRVSLKEVYVCGNYIGKRSTYRSMIESSRAKIELQIGEMLLTHANENLEAMRYHYLRTFFDNMHQHISKAQASIQGCLSKLEARRLSLPKC
jgi:hypothetical protein